MCSVSVLISPFDAGWDCQLLYAKQNDINNETIDTHQVLACHLCISPTVRIHFIRAGCGQRGHISKRGSCHCGQHYEQAEQQPFLSLGVAVQGKSVHTCYYTLCLPLLWKFHWLFCTMACTTKRFLCRSFQLIQLQQKINLRHVQAVLWWEFQEPSFWKCCENIRFISGYLND